MIRWNKTLEMFISYIKTEKAKDKRNKLGELKISYVPHSRFTTTMKLHLPDGGSILIDSEYMKSACEKAIALENV